MDVWREEVVTAEPTLTEMDRVIGDADHGVNMRRGMETIAVCVQESAFSDMTALLRAVSTTLMSSVGGAAGPLYGAFFLQFANAVLHQQELGLSGLIQAVEAGYRGVVHLGKAAPGDKTMVDALAAAIVSLRLSASRRDPLPEALEACQAAVHRAALETIPMIARRGRASYLGVRSAGYPDPGAASAALLFRALARAAAPFPSSLPSRRETSTRSRTIHIL